MDVRHALKEQYRAALDMLINCIERCPEDLWVQQLSHDVEEDGRTCTRSFWRIAFHAVYFTHLYMGKDEEAFQPWPNRKPGYYEEMWGGKPWGLEPLEFPFDAEVTTKDELLDYIRYVDSILDATIDAVDLSSNETGIAWYKNMTKLSHEMLTLRHLQGHVGQLSELLMARGIDSDWISRRR